MTAAVVADT